jgi:DNA/RNA-binding domain of Phe-tRNA-synthetase-like protein
MSAYERYYKRFDKTYHVQLQVESIVLKGKNLPDVSPLVDSNFIAEVETLVLTAGHDVFRLQGPILMDVSREGDQITQMNGTSRAIRAGDMIMKDANGICCSIIYGQDNRSPISPETSHVLYVAYAPVGVPTETVEAQLQKIEENIRLFSPLANVEQLRLLSA